MLYLKKHWHDLLPWGTVNPDQIQQAADDVKAFEAAMAEDNEFDAMDTAAAAAVATVAEAGAGAVANHARAVTAAKKSSIPRKSANKRGQGTRKVRVADALNTAAAEAAAADGIQRKPSPVSAGSNTWPTFTRSRD